MVFFFVVSFLWRTTKKTINDTAMMTTTTAITPIPTKNIVSAGLSFSGYRYSGYPKQFDVLKRPPTKFVIKSLASS